MCCDSWGRKDGKILFVFPWPVQFSLELNLLL